MGPRFLAFWDFFRAIRDSLTASHRHWKAMSKPRDDRQKDLLLPALDHIFDIGCPVGCLAGRRTNGQGNPREPLQAGMYTDARNRSEVGLRRQTLPRF